MARKSNKNKEKEQDATMATAVVDDIEKKSAQAVEAVEIEVKAQAEANLEAKAKEKPSPKLMSEPLCQSVGASIAVKLSVAHPGETYWRAGYPFCKTEAKVISYAKAEPIFAELKADPYLEISVIADDETEDKQNAGEDK